MRTHTRRGASAFEFALVAPVLLAMAMGTIDYGWYFTREAQVTTITTSAAKAGSNVVPGMAEAPGSCGDCIDAAVQYAQAGLAELGIPVGAGAIDATIMDISGTCALVVDVAVPHDNLVGIVPLPDSYNVRGVALLQNVSGC